MNIALPTTYDPSELRVLIVDDHDPMRKGIRRVLGSMGIVHVQECFDGVDAVQALDRQQFDLVICDLVMRKMNGVGVLRHVRSREVANDTPFIMVSGEASTEEIIRCVDIGADAYLLKPFQIEDLKKKVDATLEAYLKPSPALKLLRVGERALMNGKPEEALKHFQAAMTVDPAWARARQSVAVALDKMGKTEEAIKFLEENAEANPNYYRNYTTLANIHLRLKNQPDAVSNLRKELVINPRQPDRQYLLGRLLAKEGAWDEALARLREALKEDPRNKDYLLKMSKTLAEAGNLEKAVATYKRVRRFFPDCTEALEGIVVSCQAANDSKRALFALKDERNAFPGRSDTYRVLAALQTKMDLGDEAIATLKDLATRQPEFVAGLKDLAKLHTERKEWEEALAVWTRIVDKEPTKDSCLELARLHQELGQTAQAARNFFRALCLDGTDPRAFAGLGISHQLGNQPSKAYLLMGRALALGITANRLQERYVECRKILQDRRLGLKKVAS